MEIGIPSPAQAATNLKDKHDARVKAAMDKLRPHVVNAMNTGSCRVVLSLAFKPTTEHWTQTNQFAQGRADPPDTYVDVAREAAALLSAEIEAAGWAFATVSNDELLWGSEAAKT